MFARGVVSFYAGLASVLGLLLAILTGSWWLAIASGLVGLAGTFSPLFLKCPKCDYPIWKSSGSFPWEEVPKNPHDPICAKCGRDLRAS